MISRRIITVRMMVIIMRLKAYFDRNQRAIFFLLVAFTIFKIYLYNNLFKKKKKRSRLKIY